MYKLNKLVDPAEPSQVFCYLTKSCPVNLDWAWVENTYVFQAWLSPSQPNNFHPGPDLDNESQSSKLITKITIHIEKRNKWKITETRFYLLRLDLGQLMGQLYSGIDIINYGDQNM